MKSLKGESKYPHINGSYVKDENDLKADCDTKFNSGIQGKMYYMLQWMQNINFLAGNQWISYNSIKKEFEINPILEDEERVTINKILPAYRTAVGSLLRDRQKAKVLQVNNDEESIDASKVATKLLDHVWRVNDGLSIQKECLEWSAICGKGIRKKWYDPDLDRIVDEVIQPFEWVTPSNVRKLDKMPWVCHARYETNEWVYEHYGIDTSDDKDNKSKNRITTGTSDSGQYGSFLSAVKHVMEDGTLMGSNFNTNNVLVKEFWFRPSRKYPKGLLAIYLNDELIYADKNPISQDDEEFYFPFNEMDFFDVPFRYWPLSLIEPIIGLQSYYNKFQSYALDSFKTNGFTTIWAQDGTVTQEEVISDGKTVNFYAGATPPHVVNNSVFDGKLFEIVSQMSNGMGEIVGIHQFGRGGLPPGVHAAAALAIINEQDQITKMGLSVNLERFMRTDAKQTLYLVRKFWPKKSKIRVMGEENRWEVIDFDKSVLIGEEEIEIESKQELAQDKMTRFDQVLKLITTPKLDNPKESIMDVNAGLRILDLESEMGTVDLRSLNWNMAKDENQKLSKGDQVEAYQYEDHKMHIEAHMQFMLRIEFKDLEDKVKQAFMQHYQQHTQMMNSAQQSIGAQATQSDPNQQQGQMMQQMGQPGMMPPMGQQMPGQMGQALPMQQQQPMQPPQQPMPMGLQPGFQGGMTNVMNQAAGRPGGIL